MLPKQPDAAFVCAMEDVLEVYTRPYDPKRPVVCVDEASKQLVADVTPPLAMQPGQPAREDYEYGWPEEDPVGGTFTYPLRGAE